MLRLQSFPVRYQSPRLPNLVSRLIGKTHKSLSTSADPEPSSQQPPRPPPGTKFPVWQSFACTALCGAGLLYYFNKEKTRIESNRRYEATGGVGAPKLGGSLRLTDQDGNLFDSTRLKDKFMLVYFGFTHCPDVCPEELDRMGAIMKIVDFHPSFVGLTGNKDDVKATARKYRVYFRPARTSGTAIDSRDYLIDHSIFFFLIDPEGKYVTHFGRDASVSKCAQVIVEALQSWDISK